MLDVEVNSRKVTYETFFNTQKIINWKKFELPDMSIGFISYLSIPIVKQISDATKKYANVQKSIVEQRSVINAEADRNSAAIFSDIQDRIKTLSALSNDIKNTEARTYLLRQDVDQLAVKSGDEMDRQVEDAYTKTTVLLSNCAMDEIAKSIDLTLLDVAYVNFTKRRGEKPNNHYLLAGLGIWLVTVTIIALLYGLINLTESGSVVLMAWIVFFIFAILTSALVVRRRSQISQDRYAMNEVGRLSRKAILDLKEKIASALEDLDKKNLAQMNAPKDSERLVELQIESSLQYIKNAYQVSLDEFKKNTFYRLANFQKALIKKKNAAGYITFVWKDPSWSEWKPSVEPPRAVRIGTVVTSEFSKTLRSTFQDLEFDAEIPVFLKFPTSLPLLMQTNSNQRANAVDSLQAIAARLLATVPPGRVRFTFIDPIGLGQNVAAFLPLGDYDEKLVTSRAWSEPEHIDKRLKELTEHLENVIQKYLRHEFRTIEDYNNQAHEVAEPYRVLMIFDFPVNFTEASARRLVSLVQNGPRCGVFPIILHDTSKPLPYGFSIEDLLTSTKRVVPGEDGWKLLGETSHSIDLELNLDPACPPELLKRIVQEVGEAAKETMTVVVPYAKVLGMAGLDPEQPVGWAQASQSNEADAPSSADALEIPLGSAGARKPQQFTLNDDSPHALIAGQTGQGKSNLLHVIITTLALKYSPRELELYLVDLKGVEFKAYAKFQLPHARVIATESEREFGLSVLEGLANEMDARRQAFRAADARKISTYRCQSSADIARIVLVIDEFQELFREEDRIAQQSRMLLEGLVRQGRSFGIHVLLVSQSLGGSASGLGKTVIDQMQIRIALPCSEADSRLILADDNPAARLLSRPGEAIYNDSRGLVEGNNRFQVALISEQETERHLSAIAQLAEGWRRPIIFEGHEPAALEQCAPLAALLAEPQWPVAAKSVDVWLGEPVALKAPTSVRFRRQGGANLLIVTREEAEGVGLLSACVLGLAAQHRPESAKLFIVDLATADASWADVAGDLADLLPHRPEVLGRRDIPGLLKELTDEIRRRIDGDANAAAWSGYLIIQGLHRARDLRADPNRGYSFSDEAPKASPSEQFATILREGPEVGIHTLVWCDTYLNLDRTLETRALVEFGYRVAGSMSEDDSRRLLDDAAAARLDRPHRMVKYDEDQVGVLEKFRPYGIPPKAWLEQVTARLCERQGEETK